MARDDSFMAGGLTTPSRRDRIKKETEKDKLEPQAEAVLAEIQTELDSITNIASFVISEETPDPAVVAKLKFKRLQYAYLIKLQKRMKVILGKKYALPEETANE